MPWPPNSVSEGIMFLSCPVRPFIYSSCQILLAQYLMNGLNNFDETDMKYSLALIGDLVRF